MPQIYGLYYHESGHDAPMTPPLVLIHGAGGTHLHWPPEIRRLNGFHVLAPDLPGHGKSSDIRGLQRIPEYAEWIFNWLSEMHIRQAVIAGHSMGGAVALALALNHPEAVAGLALISTGAKLPVNPLILEETATQASFLKAVEKIIKWSFSPQAPARLVELAHQRMTEVRQSVLHGDLLACNEYDSVSQLSRITCPALVVCGKEDRMTPYRLSQHLAGELPHARLELIPEAGHMVMLEQPHAVAQVLKVFVDHQIQNREVV